MWVAIPKGRGGKEALGSTIDVVLGRGTYGGENWTVQHKTRGVKHICLCCPLFQFVSQLDVYWLPCHSAIWPKAAADKCLVIE